MRRWLERRRSRRAVVRFWRDADREKARTEQAFRRIAKRTKG